MTTELWNKIKLIFDQALSKPPLERRKFIEQESNGDYLIIQEVESLLASYDEAGDFFDVPQSLIPSQHDPEGALINSRIGAYKIIKWIAHGGMGTVYLGERSDKQYKKLVAVKLINPGMGHEYILKRFQNERQTLANLDHPNIAGLIDAGTTENGLPYFIMEYIEGEPIDQYCDNNKLSIHARLDIFRVVCDAVHYAHQNLIVHRDIKPGNILVTKDGIPKLLDFGIAKILDAQKEEFYSEVTRTGIWHLTPEYASPEQINGSNITTSSDVYSLGILLYKLLSGHQPYRIKSNHPSDVNKIVSDVHPTKPSIVVNRTEEINITGGNVKVISPETISRDRKENIDKIRKQLSGDLDNIILKAVRKEPQRRYTSVEQFSEDIRRHLAGLPVIARKDTFRYRSSKFIIRHKIGFASAVVILIIFFAGLAAVLWQSNIANEQRDKAQLEAKKSNEVKLFIQNMFTAADPANRGKDARVSDVLKEASLKIDNELKDQPELQAEISSTIGTTYQNLGMYDEAGLHFNRALSLKEKLYTHSSTEYAGALKDMALLFHYKGDFAAADSFYLLSVSTHRKAGGTPTMQLAEALNDYGVFLSDESKFDESEKLLREAIQIIRSFNMETELLGSAVNNLAITLDYKGDYEAAEKLYRESYNFFSDKYGDFHPRVATAINNLAFISIQKRDFDEAENLFSKAYEMKVKIYGHDHPDIGLALHNWGSSLFQTKKYDEAEKKLKAALAIYDKSLKKDHIWYSNTLHWLGKVYTVKNDLVKAESCFREALSNRKKLFNNPSHFAIAATESELANCLVKAGRYVEAEKMLLNSFSILKNSLGEKSEYTITAQSYLRNLYRLWGKSDKAGVVE